MVILKKNSIVDLGLFDSKKQNEKLKNFFDDFYKLYKDSIGNNYYDIATKMNEIKWNDYE